MRKSAEDRKAEIASVVLRLAAKVGPDRLTTEDIAQAVGLSQPAIFRHFPRKQDIWQAVAARIGADMATCWTKAGNGSGTPSGRLRALVEAQLRLIQSTPALPAILFSRELHAENEGLRQTFVEMMGRFHQVLRSAITDGIRMQEFRDDIDAADAAWLVLGLIQGLAVRWSLSARAFPLVDEGRRLLELQLRGMIVRDVERSQS